MKKKLPRIFFLPSPLGFRQVDPHAIFACMFCINCCIGIHPSWKHNGWPWLLIFLTFPWRPLLIRSFWSSGVGRWTSRVVAWNDLKVHLCHGVLESFAHDASVTMLWMLCLYDKRRPAHAKWNLKAHMWYQLSPFPSSNVAICDAAPPRQHSFPSLLRYSFFFSSVAADIALRLGPNIGISRQTN